MQTQKINSLFLHRNAATSNYKISLQNVKDRKIPPMRTADVIKMLRDHGRYLKRVEQI